MARLNVNTDACVVLTNKLEKLNRSAFPLAVRQTLNDAAFDVKNNTLQKSASNKFIRRSPNFFKTFSTVNKATGFNITKMQSVVGMDDKGKGKAAETAVKNMEYQELGGNVNQGAIYLSDARGGNNAKSVKKSNYYKSGRFLTGPVKGKGTKKSRFIASAFASKKHKAKFSLKTGKGRFLMEVTSIRKSKSGIKIKSKLLMKSRSGHSIKIKPTHFSSEAAEMTSRKIERLYYLAAEKQFAKVLR